MHSERKNGEHEQNIDAPMRHMFVKNFDGPQNRKDEKEQKEKHFMHRPKKFNRVLRLRMK